VKLLDRLSRRVGPRRLALGIGLVTIALLAIGTRGLSFGLYGDEPSFLATSLDLTDPGEPWSNRIDGYDEFATPLSFLVFGFAARLDGGSPELARLVSLASAAALFVLVAWGSRRPGDETPRAVVGLVANPYVLLTAVLLYSDVPAAALCVGAMLAHRRRHHALAGIVFALAIATRQFAIVFPLAIVTAAWWPVIIDIARRRAPDLPERRTWMWSLAAAATYGIWVVMFGGVTNETALDVRLAPEAQQSTFGLEPSAGVHALAVLTTYFVLVEIVVRPDLSILRELRAWTARHTALVAATVFAVLVTGISLQGSGLVLNVVERVPTEAAQTLVMATLAAAAVIRFSRGGVATWFVLGHVLLMTKSYQWDKYAMAPIAVLWLMSTWETRATADDAEVTATVTATRSDRPSMPRTP